MPQERVKDNQDDCVIAGCDGGDPESEKQEIMRKLDHFLRSIPNLLDLLAQIDPEEEKKYLSSLISVLKQRKAVEIMEENSSQQKRRKKKYNFS